jgi:hypothetical protein
MECTWLLMVMEQSTLWNLHSKYVNKIMTKKYSNLHT